MDELASSRDDSGGSADERPPASGLELPFGIERCSITGYRAIAKTTFHLGNTNLLVGVNGAGKTSVLRSLVFLLEDVVRRIGSSTTPGTKPQTFDFRERRVALRANLRAEGNIYHLGRTWESVDASVENKIVLFPGKVNVKVLSQLYWAAIDLQEDDIALPLLAFYPVSRSVNDVPLRVRKEQASSRREGYARAFTAERHFGSFFQWFREQEDVENETGQRDPQLRAVRHAIESAMPGYTNLRVSRRPRLRMLIDKEDQILSVQQLSDGEQGVLALIGDMARRAAILNPHLEKPLECPGCVLIDEIDQHLHPQWQRQVVGTLRQVFPNVQFVLTSHSPIVCGSVEPDSLLVLRSGRIEAASVYGWSIATILKAVFDVDERPKSVHDYLVRLDEAIDTEDFDRAHRILHALLEILPPDDPEIVRANVLLPVLEEVVRNR